MGYYDTNGTKINEPLPYCSCGNTAGCSNCNPLSKEYAYAKEWNRLVDEKILVKKARRKEQEARQNKKSASQRK